MRMHACLHAHDLPLPCCPGQATITWLATWEMETRLLGQLAGLKERIAAVMGNGLLSGAHAREANITAHVLRTCVFSCARLCAGCMIRSMIGSMYVPTDEHTAAAT